MSCDSSENYDVAVVAFAEEWEGRFDEVYLREEDYFELVADEVLGCGGGGEFFDGAYDSYNPVRYETCNYWAEYIYLLKYNTAEYRFVQIPPQLLQQLHHIVPSPSHHSVYHVSCPSSLLYLSSRSYTHLSAP